MNATRARYLLDNPVNFEVRFSFPSPLNQPPFFTGSNKPVQIHTDGVTIDEYNFTASIWSLLPNNASFSDALEVVAKGS